MTKKLNATTEVVREAMKITSKDVRAPKAVRDGKVFKDLMKIIKNAPKDAVVNTRLKNTINIVIFELIAKEYRKEALDIMMRSSKELIGEFLYYYHSGKDNIVCLVIDSAKIELVKKKKMKQGLKDQFGKPY
jgi:predicted DNA binding CopG/RHH family protein